MYLSRFYPAFFATASLAFILIVGCRSPSQNRNAASKKYLTISPMAAESHLPYKTRSKIQLFPQTTPPDNFKVQHLKTTRKKETTTMRGNDDEEETSWTFIALSPRKLSADRYPELKIMLALSAGGRPNKTPPPRKAPGKRKLELSEKDAAGRPTDDKSCTIVVSWKCRLFLDKVFQDELLQEISAAGNYSLRIHLGEQIKWVGYIESISITIQSPNNLPTAVNLQKVELNAGAKRIDEHNIPSRTLKFSESTQEGWLVPLEHQMSFRAVKPLPHTTSTGYLYFKWCSVPYTEGMSHDSSITFNIITFGKRIRISGSVSLPSEGGWHELRIPMGNLSRYPSRVIIEPRLTGSSPEKLLVKPPAQRNNPFAVALSEARIEYESSMTPEANIVLVSIDTLRADHLGCYGYPFSTSPEIDQLSKRALLAQRVYSSGASTTPAHGTMLTSMEPYRHGGINVLTPLKHSAISVAQILKKRGYFTFAVTGGAAVSSAHHFNRGFYQYIESYPGINGLSLRFLPLLNKRQGVASFSFYHTYEVHGKYKYHRGITEFLAGERGMSLEHRKKPEAKKIASSERDTLLYDSGIRYTDWELRKLFTVISQADMDVPLLMMFTSDHGEHLGEYGLRGHANSLFREVLQVPLMIYQQGSRKNIGTTKKTGIITQILSLKDIAPTICAFVGATIPLDMKGRNLLDIEGNTRHDSAKVFSACLPAFTHTRFFSLISPPYKLISRNQHSWIINIDAQKEDVLTAHLIIPPSLKQQLSLQLEAYKRHYLTKHKIAHSTGSVGNSVLRQLEALGYVKRN